MNLTTQEKILIAAEKEFLEKGYEKAKISNIAKEAGINHAMVHYYYSTKESLFDIVFKNKIDLLVKELEKSIDQGGDFFQQLEFAIDYHLSFIISNPKLLLFLLGEASTDSELFATLQSIIFPRVSKILERLHISVEEEIRKGTIKSTITAEDLLLDIVSLNASSALAVSLLDKIENKIQTDKDAFIQHRKKHIINQIINSIKV